jgi:hypothetical protein
MIKPLKTKFRRIINQHKRLYSTKLKLVSYHGEKNKCISSKIGDKT